MSIKRQSIYRGYSVNASKEDGYSLCTDIHDKYLDHLEDMTKRHSKVLQTRFDLHLPQDHSPTLPRNHLSTFHSRLAQDINRKNKMPKEGHIRSTEKLAKTHDPDPRIILAPEQHDNSPHQHIHCVVQVNGNAYKNGHDIQERAKRQWANILKEDYKEGLVDLCNRSGPSSIFIDRNAPTFDEKLNEASYQASYLAKERGKDKRPKGQWRVLSTRIPK